MNFKKILSCLLVLFALFTLAACGKDDPESFTVSFDAAGGSAVTSQLINKGECATLPLEPTKDGYTFAGWYSGETAWDFATPITADTALTAKWEKTVYTITYIDMDKTTPITGLTPATFTVEDADFVLPAATKEHYNFMGWYLVANPTYSQSIQTVPTGTFGDITVYASFEVHNYAINYVLVNTGAKNNDNNLLSYNVESQYPIVFGAPSCEGYDFAGWYADANYTTPMSSITAVSGDVTVYAKWTEKAPVNSYTITYMDGETAITGLNPTNYVEGTGVLTLPIPQKLQHDFEGWYTTPTFDEGTKVTEIAAAATGNVTLYAKFVENQLPPPVYNIVYKDGTAIISGLTPATYTAGEGVAVLPTPEKAHYRFDGWYTDASFANGTKLEAITAHSVNDVTLYAKFTPVSYTITYSLGGGVNSDSNPTSYTVLDTATLVSPTKDGCTFAGWYTDVYLNNQITSLEGQSGNLVLYAKWIQIEGSGILTPPHYFGTGE